ncbi:MAG: alpha/beta hydrolase [Pseudonocardia sp.]|nr:alpha/beta hydrolase [Pseudonocardia sp.]
MHIFRSPDAHAALRLRCERMLDRHSVHDRRLILDTTLGSTHVTKAGPAGPDVVVLPGANLCAPLIPTLITMLAARFRVSVVDVPGQPGLSSAERPEVDRVTRYRHWLDDLLPRITSGPAILVGHSLGAAISLCATPQRRIGGLVLISPAGLVSARTGAAQLRTVLSWRMRPTPARSTRLLEMLSGPGFPRDEDLVEWLTLVGSGMRTSPFPGPLPGSVLERWRATSCRILVGSEDCYLSQHSLGDRARLWLDTVPRPVTGCGHLVPVEDPGSIVAAVTEVSEPGRLDARL